MTDSKDILIGFGAGITLALLTMLSINVEDNHNYYCESLNITKHCDRLSESQNRCYPTEGTTRGYKDCSTSWLPIIREQQNKQKIYKEYICSVERCVERVEVRE